MITSPAGHFTSSPIFSRRFTIPRVFCRQQWSRKRLGRVSGGSFGATDGKLPSISAKHPPDIHRARRWRDRTDPHMFTNCHLIDIALMRAFVLFSTGNRGRKQQRSAAQRLRGAPGSGSPRGSGRGRLVPGESFLGRFHDLDLGLAVEQLVGF